MNNGRNVIDVDNQDNYQLKNPITTPEHPDDKNSTISNIDLLIAAAVMLVVLFSVTFYKRKNR